ncbi:MAG TPA: hypothetical protein VK762_07500 [Polyangiaceae bacterium]|jgi:hypothetical protein|nr:hypothetical protein [Polyangiaceae bacterium]
MPTLRSQLDALAASFANQIMASLRGASLHDLVGKTDGGRVVGNGRRARGGGGQPDPLVVPTKPRKPGRLPRRSAEEIAATLNKIVLLVKTQKNGMRAEEIRSKLGMQAKEMPRILKEGLSKKKLTSKGNKRATTYFAK